MFQSTHPYRVRPHDLTDDNYSVKFQSTHPYRVRLRCRVCSSTLACFNPRTHTGCDIYADYFRNSQWVSIHAPIQGATVSPLFEDLLTEVSIHAPIQGATGVFAQRYLHEMFQSTHPYRVRPPASGATGIFRKFQSTHPYRVRRCPFLLSYNTYCVSIHAPIQGATAGQIDFYFDIKVSIHAPIQGATHECGEGEEHKGCFNPRTHTGCDVSVLRTLTLLMSFNPRTHTGCDNQIFTCILILDMFQSTHPYRVRQRGVTSTAS